MTELGTSMISLASVSLQNFVPTTRLVWGSTKANKTRKGGADKVCFNA
jgi:hypothetical protein